MNGAAMLLGPVTRPGPQEKWAEASPFAEEAVAIYRETNSSKRWRAARAIGILAQIQAKKGDPHAASATFHEAVENMAAQIKSPLDFMIGLL